MQLQINIHKDTLLTDEVNNYKVGNILDKAAGLRIVLNIDGAPIASKITLTHHTLKPLVY
jgi:hypothetical protein